MLLARNVFETYVVDHIEAKFCLCFCIFLFVTMSISKQSKYALRMSKLSSKIFNDYIKPEIPHELTRKATLNPIPRNAWHSFHDHNAKVVERTSARPAEYDTFRNPSYYPGHPQIRALMNSLREHGLYR